MIKEPTSLACAEQNVNFYTYRASMSDDASFEQRREPALCAIVSDHISRLFKEYMPLLRCSSNTTKLK